MSRRLALGLAILAAVAARADAREWRKDEPSRLPGESRARGKEEVFRRVDAYMLARVRDSLGLSDEQYARAVPVVLELQSARRDYFVERGRQLRELRNLLRSGVATEAQVEAALAAVKRIDAEGPERIREATAAVDALLSPVQQAKYRVLEFEVERRVRELMGRARKERSRGRDEDP